VKNEDILNQVLESDGGEFTMIIVGFSDAYMGLTANKPVRVIYDYYKCLDNLIHQGGWEFDEAVDYLDELVNENLQGLDSENSSFNYPLYIKQI